MSNYRMDSQVRVAEKLILDRNWEYCLLVTDLSVIAGDCWIWTGGYDGPGYGVYWIVEVQEQVKAHRLSFICHRGPIPFWKEIDHTCNNRACVNPAHLEAVTHQENVIRGWQRGRDRHRKTVCAHGHDLTLPGAVYVFKNGRSCRLCALARRREYYLRDKALMLESAR